MIHFPCRILEQKIALLAGVLAVLWPAFVDAQQANKEVLHIGTSGTITPGKEGSKGDGGLTTLQNFIKEETGFTNEIIRQNDWHELAEKMSKGELKLGVFQGIEFAWAAEQYPDLKPLVLAVNVTPYPVAYLVTRRDDPAKDFTSLQGHSLCLPENGQTFLRLFAERQSKANNKDFKSFFSKTTTQAMPEDCLDDVVDGVAQATVVDRAALESYKQNKSGRFTKLKDVGKSEPFPPVVIAYYDKKLDFATLQTFRAGLLGVSSKERGRSILDSFRLTSFDAVPNDFGKVLEESRRSYPSPTSK